jgi:diacylglycerol O-acyltransferase
MILDRPPSRADLVERLAGASEHAPRLRQRPGDPSYVRRRPVWTVDPDFDPGLHVRTFTVPPPGELREVLDLVGLLEPVPFEPERSPWDVTIIDGLAGGKGALYMRAHHVLTDGFGGTSIIGLLLDERRPMRTRSELAGEVGVESDDGSDGGYDARPGAFTIDFSRAFRPLAAGVRPLTAGVAASLSAEPTGAVVRGVQRSLDVANSVSRQVLVAGGPLGAWPGLRSMATRFEILSVTGARAASLALGGSRNTLLVAAAATGIGLYLEGIGEPCPELRVATPTSLRHSSEVGGNWFAPIRVEVPTTVGHPGPQFGVVAERLARARSEPALRLTSTLASTVGRLPSRLLIPALHAQADTVDFAATTLPGSRSIRHVCGATIEESYPFGPRLGCPVNISAYGNGDRLDVGISLDPGTIVDPDTLLDCLSTAFSGFVPYRDTQPATSDDAGDTGPSPG